MYTPWGYEVESLPPIISASDYQTITGRTATDEAVKAASAAIRNVCGWHVAPSIECTASVVPNGRLLNLPARYVSAISSVTESGESLTSGDYEARQDGLIRRCGFRNWGQDWQGITIVYTAGFSLDAVPDLADIAIKIIDAAQSVPVGVASETAGNVSISYDTAVSAVSAQAALAYAFALAPYKLVSSHAA